MLLIVRRTVFFLCSSLAASAFLWGAAGQEAVSFLDIPVGAEPAALGSAYTALADNAYATVWNPAGLARLDVAQMAAMHLSYLDSISYEQLSGAIPWHSGGFGFSVQSLGSGDIDQRDEFGNAAGTFSSSFGAYSLGYGQALSPKMSLGFMAKALREKIASTSGTAYAADLGWLYLASPNWTLGAALSNLGTALKLVDQADPLPLQGRVGAAWRASTDFQFSSDVIYRRNGPAAGALGVEWSNSIFYALRAGYNSSHIKELSVGSGFSAGVALRYLGQEFAYAWVPFGELGNTHYFSLLIRFTTTPRRDRAYPELSKVRLHQAKEEDTEIDHEDTPAAGYHDFNNIEDVLTDDEKRSLKKFNSPSQASQ